MFFFIALTESGCYEAESGRRFEILKIDLAVGTSHTGKSEYGKYCI